MIARSRVVAAVLLGGAGVVIGLLAAALVAAPRVTAFSPQGESAHIPATTRLSIVFNRPMDTSSVEEHLSIEPRAAGRWTWEGRTTASFQPAVPWPAGATVTVRLGAGARSGRFLPLLRSYTWSLTIGLPRIAYLWPAGDAADIYLRTLDGEQTTRLTTAPLGVYDFSLASGGSVIIYSAQRSDGGTDLHWLDLASGEDDLVYPCPAQERCRAATVSPDGNLLAFERYSVQGEVSGPSRVWALPLESGEVYPIGPEGHVSASPLFSPQGVLAYHDATLGAVVLVDPSAGPEPPTLRVFPSELGIVGSWSPDGEYLVFPEIIFPQGLTDQVSFYSHLYRAEVSTGDLVDLWRTGFGQVEDAGPVYSADGQWIAFARKHLEGDLWTLGRQLWVMRADGSGARALSDEPDYNHSAIAWSADSTTLVYMRFNQSDFTQASEIWVSGLEEGQARRLAVGGYLPQWVP
jgi:Tol biopolymer transport system component